jgi:hypothetical protein
LVVVTISQFNAVSQRIETYNHSFGNFGNFTVSTRKPYRVETDITGVTSGTAIWALVGSVPPITNNTYTLSQTATTDFTWVMQPLEMGSVTLSHDLALNIGTNSSGAVKVITIARWNSTSQRIETYAHAMNYGNFTTRFGYPYRVEISITGNNSVTWPSMP